MGTWVRVLDANGWHGMKDENMGGQRRDADVGCRCQLQGVDAG